MTRYILAITLAVSQNILAMETKGAESQVDIFESIEIYEGPNGSSYAQKEAQTKADLLCGPSKISMKKLSLTILLVVCVNTAFANSTLEANKQAVMDFYNLAFNEHKPTEAMKKFVGDKYIQHNPYAGDGKKPFIDFFTSYYAQNKEAFVEIKRIVAENDLVILHVHSRKNKTDTGTAVVDIFRVKNGKIVEHWDVAQDIPEKIPHKNTMF